MRRRIATSAAARRGDLYHQTVTAVAVVVVGVLNGDSLMTLHRSWFMYVFVIFRTDFGIALFAENRCGVLITNFTVDTKIQIERLKTLC
jgi:hypothetical protein